MGEPAAEPGPSRSERFGIDLAALAGLVVPGRFLDGDDGRGAAFDWRGHDVAIIEAVRRHRLTGALVEAVEAGAVVVSDIQARQLEQDHISALAWCMRVEDRMCDVVEALERDGVRDVLILKGSAIAHLDEVEPSIRTFGDLDVLVRAEDLERSLAALARLGAHRPYAERRPGFDRRFAKSITVTFEDGVEVDLHRTLCDGVHAVRIPLDRLFQKPETFEVAGRRFAALDLDARLLHAAYHAVLGSPQPRLMSRRDIAGYLHRTEGAVEKITAEAGRWRGTAVLAEAVRAALDLGVDVPNWSRWVADVEPDLAEFEILAGQRRDGSSYGWSRLAVVRELPTWRERAAYTWGVLAPSRDHLRSRGLVRGSLLRRAARRSGAVSWIGHDDSSE